MVKYPGIKRSFVAGRMRIKRSSSTRKRFINFHREARVLVDACNIEFIIEKEVDTGKAGELLEFRLTLPFWDILQLAQDFLDRLQ